MKYLLLVVILAVFATVNPQTIDWDQIDLEEELSMINDCQMKDYTKEDGKQIEKFAGQLDNAPLEVKETVVCILRFGDLFSRKTGFDADTIINRLSPFTFDKVKGREIIVKCADKNEQNSTTVEWAYRGLKCFKENGIFQLFNKEEIKQALANNRDGIDLTEAFEVLSRQN